MPPKFTSTKKASTETSASLYDQLLKMQKFEKRMLGHKDYIEGEVSGYKKYKKDWDKEFEKSFQDYIKNRDTDSYRDWKDSPDSARVADRLYNILDILGKPIIEYADLGGGKDEKLKSGRVRQVSVKGGVHEADTSPISKPYIKPPTHNRNTLDQLLYESETEPYYVERSRYGDLARLPLSPFDRKNTIKLNKNPDAIGASGEMSTLLHELGHTMQWLKMMPGSREGKDFYDRLSMDKRQIKSKYSPYGSVYSDPHTLEYQADRPLKRMLWDYVFHGD